MHPSSFGKISILSKLCSSPCFGFLVNNTFFFFQEFDLSIAILLVFGFVHYVCERGLNIVLNMWSFFRKAFKNSIAYKRFSV